MFRLSQQGWDSPRKQEGLDTSSPEESVKEQRCSLLHGQTKYTLMKPCRPRRNQCTAQMLQQGFSDAL